MSRASAVIVSASVGALCAMAFSGLASPWPARAGNSQGGSGDANGDGSLDIADCLYTLMHLFRGGPPPAACADSPALTDRIAALEAAVSSLRGLTAEETEILSHVTITEEPAGTYCIDPDFPQNCRPIPFHVKTIRVSGVNLQLVNGTGRTDELNGLGNLIVGYQEERCCFSADPCWDEDTNHRGGSHNLLVGSEHNYKSHSSAAIGRYHSCWAPATCVAGGIKNIAGGEGAMVGGGADNSAMAPRSAIIGGRSNGIGQGDENRTLVGTVNEDTGGGRCAGP